MNKVILLGNLTRDIELRFVSNGTALGKTGIAVNRRAKTQTGEFRDEVMFIDLTFWGRTAEIVKQYFRKGSKILVEGRLSLDQWTDQNGMKRSKHSITVESIEFVESKNSNNSYAGNNNPQNHYQNSNSSYNYNSTHSTSPVETSTSNSNSQSVVENVDTPNEDIPPF